MSVERRSVERRSVERRMERDGLDVGPVLMAGLGVLVLGLAVAEWWLGMLGLLED